MAWKGAHSFSLRWFQLELPPGLRCCMDGLHTTEKIFSSDNDFFMSTINRVDAHFEVKFNRDPLDGLLYQSTTPFSIDMCVTIR